jgi:hypothetical protein
MLTFASTFAVPKRGSTVEEYEDATWVGPDGDGSGEVHVQSLAVALADGASESLLAGRWARRLVKMFGTSKNAAGSRAGFVSAYKEAVSSWDSELRVYMAEREERGAPIQWYEEPGLAKGAYATILAVQFTDSKAGRPPLWRAVALGDSCLFQVRDESLYASFPVVNASAFSYQPPLLASRGTDTEMLRRHINMQGNDWERGDSFYLATDALAAWFLRSYEAHGKPWEPLRDMGIPPAAPADFAVWVDEQRDLGQMHNDDTTLVRIDMW